MEKLEIAISVIELLLSIASIMGLMYLTQFAFKATVKPGWPSGNIASVKGIDDKKLKIARIASVIIWIQIALTLLGVIISIAGAVMTAKRSNPIVTVPVSAFMAMRY
jgi:hypothetical protein